MDDNLLDNYDFRMGIIAALLHNNWSANGGGKLIESSDFPINCDEQIKLVNFIRTFSTKYNRAPLFEELDIEFPDLSDITAKLKQLHSVGGLDYYKDKALAYKRLHSKQVQLNDWINKDGVNLDNLQAKLAAVDQQYALPTYNKWSTFEDIYDDADEQVEWIVENVLEAGDVMCLFGESGIGKTWFMLLMMCHVVTSLNYLGYKTFKARIFWVDQENRKKRFKRRLRAIADSMNIDVTTLNDQFQFVCMPKPPIYANDNQAMLELAQHINKYDGLKIVVFDNLGSIANVKSMSDSEMKSVMLGLNRLSDDTGAAVVVIHHKPKGNDTMYGSQYIKAYTDFALEMSSTGESHISSLTGFKQRDEEWQPLNVELIIDGYVNREALNPRFVKVADASVNAAKSKLRQSKQDKLVIWIEDHLEEVASWKLGIRETAIKIAEISHIGSYLPAYNALKALLKQKKLVTIKTGRTEIVSL